MKKVNIYLILTALLLIVLGGICITHPGDGFQAIAWLIGLLILLTGCLGLLFGMKAHKILPNAGSSRILAAFQIVVGLLFLCNKVLAAEAIIVIFAMWILFEGISLSVLSIDYKRAGYERWWLMLILGVCSMFLSFLAMRNPTGVGNFMGLLLGLGILANGVERIVAFFGLKRIEKQAKENQESTTPIDIDDEN